MAVFADYHAVVAISRIFIGAASLPLSYTRATGQPGFLDFELFGGFRPDPTDPTGQTGLQTMNLDVSFDGGAPTTLTVQRWTEHTVITPYRQLIVIPPNLNQVARVTIQPADGDLQDFFFLGPMTMFSIAQL